MRRSLLIATILGSIGAACGALVGNPATFWLGIGLVIISLMLFVINAWMESED